MEKNIFQKNNENSRHILQRQPPPLSGPPTPLPNKQQEVLIQSLIEKVTWVHRHTVTSLRLEPPLQEEPRWIARLKVIRQDNF